jgi:transcriptional regulator with XRE-family HTH domain
MTGHRPFSELTKDFSPQRKAKIEALTNRLREEMTLQQLREALNIQQEELGELLGIKQAAVSRMERRSDMLLSHLRKTIEAMGGELIIIARFPNAEVCLNNITIENGPAGIVTENDYKAR